MASISPSKIEKVKDWYEDGHSAREIAQILNVSIDAVFYFLRKHQIPRRTPSECNNLIFQRKAPSFKLKTGLSKDEEALRVAGIMLYWGEGSNWKGEVVVDFANSNSQMIRVFLKFLRQICGIDEKKLRVYLYCYENQNPTELIKFWSGITKISRDNFTKPYARKDYKAEKSGKMKNGLVHIRYGDKKLLTQIKDWINEYVKSI